jgi:dihydropteroate synthase-like protein
MPCRARDPMSRERERILFVTGKLAEPSLRRLLAELTPRTAIESEVAVLPITVAALLTTKWIASHLSVPESFDRVILPGLVTGELDRIPKAERGPKDLRDLPEFFGEHPAPPMLGLHDIEILAEINHAPRLSHDEILAQARRYRDSGADIIDLGCEPGTSWNSVGDIVRLLRDDGLRVSIDSFDAYEVESALAAGAELVLSVNGSNFESARRWSEVHGAEVVAIPDTPPDLASLDRTVERLVHRGIRHRLDPILEPIGFGFAASLGRYVDVRQRYPYAEILMGIGNLTELTDADSAGINVILAGFCQELGIRSVLTTEVINWSRSSVKEFALARRLVFHAVKEKVVPKRLEPDLVLLRDTKLRVHGEVALKELAERITDRNYRLFAERGELHIINGSVYLRGTDPFFLFQQMLERDPKLDASHAFYLGYEFAKAVTALTLGKDYVQDRALRWGFLTVPETSHRNAGL